MSLEFVWQITVRVCWYILIYFVFDVFCIFCSSDVALQERDEHHERKLKDYLFVQQTGKTWGNKVEQTTWHCCYGFTSMWEQKRGKSSVCRNSSFNTKPTWKQACRPFLDSYVLNSGNLVHRCSYHTQKARGLKASAFLKPAQPQELQEVYAQLHKQKRPQSCRSVEFYIETSPDIFWDLLSMRFLAQITVGWPDN